MNSTSRTRARKLDDRWDKPYRIHKIPDDSTYYLLKLDRTKLKYIFISNRLKCFFFRVELDNNHTETHDTIRIQDTLEIDDEPQSGDTVDERSTEDPMKNYIMKDEPD
jgi:hypothetical protein